ncbi:MAG: hypothetical protein K8I82_15030 [Anaerolineae bacterium]|nr:hypothetical protein [Anaerolineae bacterium]
MFDESGAEYKPRVALETKITPPAETPPAPVVQVLRRPLWLHMTILYLSFSLMLRIMQFCVLTDSSAIELFAQFALTIVVGVILVGLIGFRKWGMWLFLLFCGWNMISALVVGVYRMMIMGEVVKNPYNEEWLIFTEIMTMSVVFVFYGFLALLFWWRRKIFLPRRSPAEWGGVTYTVIVSIMILVTATQMADSRAYIRLSEKELDSSRTWIQDRW